MASLKWWARHGEAGRQASEWSDSAPLETARDECTEALLVVALARGLVQHWAGSLPVPRGEPARALAVRWPAPIAARWAGRDARRTAGAGRRAARGWGAVGASVAGSDPAPGWSGRGPAEDQRLRGAGVRQRVVQRAPPAALRQPARRPPQEPKVAVTGRARASRRAVQPAVEAAEAAARAPTVAAPWVGWEHQPGGVSRLQEARRGSGRRRPLRAPPPGAGPLETGTEAGSGGVKHADGPLARGATRATLRPRLASAGLLTPVALAALQGHERAWGCPWLVQAPGVRAGARLLEERGVLDGATGAAWKRTRPVAGLLPLNAPRLAPPEARPRAAMADTWPAPPARAEPPRARGRGVAPRWTACAVPLHAGVRRGGQKKKKRPDPRVVVPPDRQRPAPWSVRPYEERPEIEPDEEQRKRGGWQRKKRRSTR